MKKYYFLITIILLQSNLSLKSAERKKTDVKILEKVEQDGHIEFTYGNFPHYRKESNAIAYLKDLQAARDGIDKKSLTSKQKKALAQLNKKISIISLKYLIRAFKLKR